MTPLPVRKTGRVLLPTTKSFFDISALEDETATLSRNVGNQKTNDEASHPNDRIRQLLASQEV